MKASKKIGNAFFALCCLGMIVISATCVTVYNLAGWVLDTWGLLTIDEIIFHLTVPIEGTNTDIVWDGINTCLPLVILVVLFMIVYAAGMKHSKWKLGLGLLCITCLSVGSGVKAAYNLYSELEVGNYLLSQKEDDKFIEEHYVDPRNVEITFPEEKRNLVYIFLESMEATYASKDVRGGLDFNCIPELTEIATNYVSFSNTDKLGGPVAVPGTGWTMGGIFGQTSGLPIKNSVGTDDMNQTLGEQMFFSSRVCNLEDILAEQGYRQCFMIGSDVTFGGRKAYFNSHGNCEIWDYYTAVEEGRIPEDYYRWWGYEDEKLFTYAREKLTELSSGSEPFNLTLLTVDTHFEDGYVCDLCQDEFGDDQYANVMACSSRQIAAFIEWIQQQDFYENTTIILCGDHPTMDKNFCEGLDEDYQRTVYNAFINLPEGLNTSYEQTHLRKSCTLDMFPTTLAALGAQIEGDRLALGTNLFSSEETLEEKYGYDEVNDHLRQKSYFYDMLINDIDYEQPAE